MVGAVLLTIYSIGATVYVPHLFSTYATRYGVIGAVFAMISTLFCVMVVLVGAAALGREVHDELGRIRRGERPADDDVRREWDALVGEARSRWAWRASRSPRAAAAASSRRRPDQRRAVEPRSTRAGARRRCSGAASCPRWIRCSSSATASLASSSDGCATVVSASRDSPPISIPSKPDQRDVGGHRQPRALQALDQPHGDVVGGRDERRRVAEVEVLAQPPLPARLEAVAQQRALERRGARALRRGVHELVADVADALVAELDQVVDRQPDAGLVVDRDAVGVVRPAGRHHDRDAVGEQPRQDRAIAGEVDQRDAVHPLLEQRLDARGLELRAPPVLQTIVA